MIFGTKLVCVKSGTCCRRGVCGGYGWSECCAPKREVQRRRHELQRRRRTFWEPIFRAGGLGGGKAQWRQRGTTWLRQSRCAAWAAGLVGVRRGAAGGASGLWVGVSPGIRRCTKVWVKTKVPPHVVHVKYKTTRYSGVQVDTPRMGTRGVGGSFFLGFCCGKFVNAA
jgi:hypothetical protein